MALEIVWTDEAKNQLDEIIAYLEENWTEREISKFFVRLEECLAEISQNPNRYKDSQRKQGTKEFQHSKHTTIFYSYDKEVVNVLLLWPNRKNSDGLI